MSYIETKEGTKIFYKDWGRGRPVVFSHGWPLCSDAWDGQMLFLLEKGFRVIAHDRRGHGRSSQTWEKNTMDQYADDFAELMNKLDLKDAILVGHSTGGGEVARYIGRHGTSRVSKVVLLGSVTPTMLRTNKFPDGLPMEAFDEIRKNVAENRAQFLKDFPMKFYNYDHKGMKVSEGVCESFWHQGMMGGIKSIYDCVKQFSESDFTEDLKKITVPCLIVHGEDDQIVPLKTSAMLSVKIAPNAELLTYRGAGHGLAVTHQNKFNEDLLRFIASGSTKNARIDQNKKEEVPESNISE
jgi:non-heme chloroperoxidase